jgi:protein-S-isoprenylcysteine O-methyltransferase Ste14
MKLSRLKKLSWKLLLVYAACLALIAVARPDRNKHLQWDFWLGAGLAVVGELVRLWAAGHLVKNQVLTTTGPYAFAKNPLYIGTFFCLVGFCVMGRGDPANPWYLHYANWILLGAGVLAFVAYYVPYKKKREGDRLRENFGADWDAYDAAVPDYFPRLTPYRHPGAEPRRWSFRAMCENSEQWTPLAIAAGIVALLYNWAILDFASKLWK